MKTEMEPSAFVTQTWFKPSIARLVPAEESSLL